MQNQQRLNTMTLLRVLATFAVVFGHACGFFSGFSFTQWPNSPYIQNLAVTAFFAISGFTIAWVCDTRAIGSGWRPLAEFAFGRATRLAVPLFPFLILCAVLERVWLGASHPHPEAMGVTSLLGNFLFLQWLAPVGSPVTVHPFGLNRALWTLAIEFWTYVAFGGIFFGCLRGNIRLWPIAVAALAIWLLGTTLFGAQGAGLPLIWALSASLYFALKHAPSVGRHSRTVALVMLALSCAALRWPAIWPTEGGYSRIYNLLIFGIFASLVVFVSRDKAASPSRIVDFFATFAYSTYVVHYPVLYALQQSAWLPDGEISVVIATALAFAAGWIWGLLFERHYRAIRDRLWNLAVKVSAWADQLAL